MNANVNCLSPLPSLLSLPSVPGRSRRRHVDGLRLSSLNLDRFNALLARLGRAAPLEGDQVASAARQLADPGHAGTPACIAERLRQAESLARMAADAAWTADRAVAPALQAVLDYTRRHDDLIPDWMPQVGRLDDAIVIDTALPQLQAELGCYRAFCRARGLEAWLRGCTEDAVPLRRTDWEARHEDEAALHEHRRQVRGFSYAPAPVDVFRVH